ncbi:enolase-phosphatase E1 [Centroberyx affinis]|uniref:enolase-phosphatase E1 n=1 Tax=Centroberyx affinis TaxID=166261 RepID=UPI003A5C2078
MLTYPSDSLPQVVCPMDEDAIPPNPFCSAPPHSEPQPPLLPLSSVTPSCENDGISGIRRSGRIQRVRDQTPKKQSHKDSRAAPRPSRQNPSPAKRERESGMVQVSQSLSVKLLRADGTHVQEKQNKDELDFDVASECPTKHMEQKSQRKTANISATENVDKQFGGNTAQDPDTPQSNTPKSDMDTCGELAVGHTVENASAVKSWVIGPLFQTFKSKMASFTEIVMSPVKLFKANSPPQFSDHPDKLTQCELHAMRASSSENSEPSETFHTEGQSKNGNEDTKDDQLSSSSEIMLNVLKCSQKLLLDVDLSACSSEQVDECTLTEKKTIANDSVPLQHSPLLCNTFEQITDSKERKSSALLNQPSDNASASCEPKLEKSSDMEEQKSKPAAQKKPLPRKRTGNRSVLKKGSSKIFLSEVKKEESNPKANGEQFSHIHSTEINDSNDTGKTQSLSSSVYYTPPDTVCLPDDDDDDDDGRNTDSGFSVRKSLQCQENSSGGVDESVLKPTLITQPVQKQILEWELKPDLVENSAASLGKAKRRLKLTSQSDIEPNLTKRKRLTADKRTEDTKNGEVLNVASDSGVSRGLKPPRNEGVSTNAIIDMDIILNPARARAPISTGTKRKGKGVQQRFPTVNEAVLQTETENPSGTMLVCSLDKSNGVSENSQKDRNGKRNTNGSSKRPKKRTNVSLSKPDVNADDMDLETTMTTTSAKEIQLLKVIVQPLDAKLRRSQSASKAQPKYVCQKKDVSPVLSVESSQSPEFMNLNRKPLKRKSQKQKRSTPELDNTSVSTASAASVETLEFTSTDLNTSQLVHREESWKTELSQPSKRPKKDCMKSVKSSGSGGAQVTKKSMDKFNEAVKESQSKEDKDKISEESVHLEMTPVENDQKPVPSPSQPYPDCFVQLNQHKVNHTMGTTRNHGKGRTTASLVDEVFPTDAEATNHSQDATIDETREELDKVDSCTYRVNISGRRVKSKPRRADKQRRKCRVLRSKAHSDEEEMNSITREELDLAGAAGPCSSENNGLSRRLLRSYSCPEIPSLLHHDAPWTSSLHSPQHGRIHTPYQHQTPHIPPVPPAHKSPRRARRHTVCSVEVEREIAPLCLRKEVYPSRRSAPYGSISQHLPPSVQLSPSTSLTVLASCFLSSPLAFLSKKLENRGAATSSSSSTCGHVSSPSSSSVFTSSTSPSISSPWHLPGFLPRTDTSAATVSSTCSAIPLECEIETRQQSEEEEDGEDTSCSSQEFEDAGLREEKALSDSEIKVVQKHEERGKVSSIRIRKTLPKPQNNLTPMGLPRPIRLKKKEFSLEEIYTNKNFTKPPESRLETVFEMPLSRRNGSQSLFGLKRVKRFVEFPEVGVARKPKKPLVGAGKAGLSTSRPRRGGYHNPKDEASLSVQELDALLCAKLDQLDLWLSFDQKDS